MIIEMAGLDCVAEYPLASRTQNGTYLRKDLRLMLERDAVMDGFPQRTGNLQLARMAEAGLPVGGVVRQWIEKEVAGHINFL